MVRKSKPERKRSVSYKRPRLSGAKSINTGEHIKRKMHVNALSGDKVTGAFVPMIG
jgi:hypothetical protein